MPLTKKQKREYAKQYKRKYRQEKAIRSIWHRLRSRSKERGHTCGISYEDFEAWCLETGYHLLRGKTAESASIDRIKDEIGYEKGNLRILSLSDNTKKENEIRNGRPWWMDKENIPYEAWKPLNTDPF